MLSLFQILTLEGWPSFLEAGQAIDPASWISFVSYVLIASFLVITILIAIIINSMEEVHELERSKHAQEPEDEIAESDVDLAARLGEVRQSLDKLETELAEGHVSLPPRRANARPKAEGCGGKSFSHRAFTSKDQM